MASLSSGFPQSQTHRSASAEVPEEIPGEEEPNTRLHATWTDLGASSGTVKPRPTPTSVKSSTRLLQSTDSAHVQPVRESSSRNAGVGLPWGKYNGVNGRLRLRWSIAILFFGAISNGYDGALINGLQSLPSFLDNLGNDISSSYKGIIIAGIALGGVFFFFPAAWMADKCGRRWTAMLGASIMLAASVVQSFTRGPVAFLVTRIFLGMGLSFTQTSCAPLVNELATPSSRPIVGSGYNASYYLGAICSAWVTFGTLASLKYSDWAWRTPCLVQAFFPLVLLLGVLFVVPESPRYLMSKNRFDEAHDLLCYLHGPEGQATAAVEAEYHEIHDSLARDASSFTYRDFLKGSANRWRFWVIVAVGFMVQWSGQGPISYYFSPILETLGVRDPLQRSSLNGGLQVWNAIFATIGALLTERLGRRPLWLLSTLGMLLSETSVTIASAVFAQNQTNKGAGYAGIVFIFFLYGSYDLAMTPLNFQYITEILPFSQRAKGLAFNQFIVFAAGFFNQYVNPVALDAIGWRYYLIYIVLLTLFLAVVWFTFPETKSRTLEQIEVIFEHGSLRETFTLRGVRGLQKSAGTDPVTARENGTGHGLETWRESENTTGEADDATNRSAA
ncbi:unnamed protein product [Sympodiomycopsis kandeliae]